MFNLRERFGNFKGTVVWRISQAILTYQSLTYNIHMSHSYLVDCFLEPILWFVDNFAGCLGKVFVFCVTVLTTAVVAIAYWVGLPYWWERSPFMALVLVVFGNWILINIVFHYYKGVTTSPGHPPEGALIEEAASICKKCITPKPPRTHHCSICDRCVLCMDHHCPWLNNCVGYCNARYFFLYMAYMVTGVAFLMIAGFELGYNVLWINDDNGGINHEDESDLIGHPVYRNESGVYVPGMLMNEYDDDNVPRAHNLPIIIITEAQRITADPFKRKAVVFVLVMCLSVFFALGTLTIIHARNITRGETSIESHINATLRKTHTRYRFRNPYNFGRRKNWKLFLGLIQGRTFLKNILFPSSHPPVGMGLSWPTVNNDIEDWP